ncbi:MAG TPA: protein TolR [Verrucomicrobia bacterium]|nr:protein TolR [Verrucomicrobiota bacterium]
MGRTAPLMSTRVSSEINLTPMMDLTFILLITFIITFPMIEQGVPINLPQGSASPVSSDANRSVISLDGAGNLYFNDRATSFDGLLEQITQLAQVDLTTTVYVRADKDVRYGEVVRVMRALHDQKLTRISLVTKGD